MERRQTDVAIIGAGTAGLTAYRRARATGARALLIEAGPPGTTCARVGCMPSKLLIAAANAAHDARMLPEFGIHVDGGIRIAAPDVLTRVRRERDRFVASVLAKVDTIPAADKLGGAAHFIAPGRLCVESAGADGRIEIDARATVIATGSHASMPKEFEVFGRRAIISDAVFDWHDLPRRVAVFGNGPVALELAQALARLGVQIRVFGRRGAVAGLTDPIIKDHAKRTLQQAYYFDPDSKSHILDMGLRDGEPEIRYIAPDKLVRTERFDYVLVATGRRPNVASLALENTGLALDSHGVPEFDPSTMRCGDSSVFIAGDAANERPWLNEAADEGRIAGENAARYPASQPRRRHAPMSIVFCDPSILMVGARHADLNPGDFVTGEVDFEDQGRSRVMLKNHGLLHLYADASSGQLLGAEGMTPVAEHFAHLLAWAVQQGQRIQDLVNMPFYHPVFEEGVRTALRDALERLSPAVCGPVPASVDAPGT